MTALGDLDRERIRNLRARELARFREARPATLAMLERARLHMPNGTPMAWMAVDYDLPVYVERGEGPSFWDLDGFSYVDFNASDMAMFCNHANSAIVRAVRAQAARSTQFLLPTVASVEVAEELARRYPVTMWQFTLSATQANTEAIRLARAVTGREVVVLFQGHYHGHFEEGVVDLDGERVAALERGLTKGVTGRVRIAQFNDVDVLRAGLEPGDGDVEPGPRRGHDWQGSRRRGADGCLWGHARVGGRASGRKACCDRRHPLREPAVGRSSDGGADRGARAGRLQTHQRSRRQARRRD